MDRQSNWRKKIEVVIRTLTDNEEGRAISSKIFDKQKQGGTFNDFAILYRINRQSRSFEEALRKN